MKRKLILKVGVVRVTNYGCKKQEKNHVSVTLKVTKINSVMNKYWKILLGVIIYYIYNTYDVIVLVLPVWLRW